LEKNAKRRPKSWKLCLDADTAKNTQDKKGEKKCGLCGKKNQKMSDCHHNPFNPKNKFKNSDLVESSIKQDPDLECNSDDDYLLDSEKMHCVLSVPITLDH